MDISAYQHMNIRMSTRGKRPLRNLTPNDKVHAIQRIHNGETKASVSRDIGVPESTLRGWCKNEQKLRFMCRQMGTDQLSTLGALDKPPEKRPKYEGGPTFSNLNGYDNYGFSRLPLQGGGNFGGNINTTTTNGDSIGGVGGVGGIGSLTNGNAILDKIALNGFLNQSNNNLPQAQVDVDKSYGGAAAHAQPLQGLGTLPGVVDCSQQLSILQNLNFLTMLNPALAALTNIGSGNGNDAGNYVPNKSKAPLRDSNTLTDEAKGNAKNNSSPTLAVKNWAKEPCDNYFVPRNNNNNNNNNNNENNNNNKSNGSCSGSNSNSSIDSSNNNNNNNNTNGNNHSNDINAKNITNDTNNNDLKTKYNTLPLTTFPDAATLLAVGQLLPPLPPLPHLPPLTEAQLSSLNAAVATGIGAIAGPGTNADPNGGGTALLEWCKVFSASLNFFALASAAAALQSPPMQPVTANISSNTGEVQPTRASLEQPADNILYKQLTKTIPNLFNLPGGLQPNSDLSNDSYIESDPEDLSMRSTNSKMSSSTNSRSQSPAKSTATSSEIAHSDVEH